MLSISTIFFIEFVIYYSTNSIIIDFNKTIEYYINTTKESFDLTIYNHLSFENCSQSYLTLINLISIIKFPFENITTIKLINLCLYIDIKTIEKFINIRRLIFNNCTIQFFAHKQREDYNFYPKNLTQWIFNQGQTDTFKQFLLIINYLDPFKFDLEFSNCFQPIFSFNDFIPLKRQLIFLNITCKSFQIDQPLNIKTRRAIFLTSTLIINTQSKLCPLPIKYSWLNIKKISLRILICENRLIELYSNNINQTNIQTTTTTTTQILSIQTTTTTTQILFIQTTTILNKLTIPILINFSVIFLSILTLFITFVIFFIRFILKK